MEERNERARAEAPAPALRLAGVSRRFPGFLGLRAHQALESIDLEVARGASLGLIGPNGSGKSTLLRLAAGVDRPSIGRVEVLGSDLAARGSRTARARLAYLPDDSPFPGELTARAALDLLGALAGLPRRERRQRAGAMLERVGLSASAGHSLHTYSRGMLRRFGLAQAFLGEPELVLLDEPTAGLDAPGYSVLEELTQAARERGASLVVASHVLSDLCATSERLAVLIDGRLVAHGAPEALLSPGANEVRVTGLDEAGRAALADWVRAHGGTTAATEAGQLSLRQLYERLAPEPRA